MRCEMSAAASLWNGILTLGCYDDKIVRRSRTHHDAWLQTVEDPYDMRFEMCKAVEEFQLQFEPILYLVSKKAQIPWAPSASEIS